MPELPEVETTRRGIEPHVLSRRIVDVTVRDPRLRWQVAADLAYRIKGQRVLKLSRRAKYLILELERGALILHLGMSGALGVVPTQTLAGKHDHFELALEGGVLLRLTDPRRFGSVHFVAGSPETHPLLAALGPEPLSAAFSPQRLYASTRGRRASIKETLMNNRVVAGIGNIYANEALFRARIHPRTPAGRLGPRRCAALVRAVAATLEDAIEAGGSSLRDWRHADGRLGYFQNRYFVYDRAGAPCRVCGASIRVIRQGQRASYYCARCQHR
jgi:formamidopyrimidine-DNA glycosylase